LREVDIATAKSQYIPGEAVEGQLVVRCDKEFQYNAIYLAFTGGERTEIVVSSGDSSTTYRDERVYFTDRRDFEGNGVMAPGETQFPFRFLVPDDVPCSYSGKCGWVEYALTGVVEVSWARDPKRKTTIEVRRPMKPPTSQSRSQSIDKDGYPEFDAEVEEDCVCLGNSVKLRFRVARDVKIRGIRAELRTEEHAIAKRQKSKRTWTLVKEYMEEPEIGRDLWMNVELKTHESMPISFEGEIVSNRSSVKVTLDIPWALDKSIVIPIQLGHYAPPSASDEAIRSHGRWSI